MPETFDKSTVIQRLADLDRRDPRRKVFGANGHGYKLRPTVPLSVIEAFEERHGISLPADYRSFITEIGDGGAGPSYGLLPFGKDDDDRNWETGGLVGDLSKPFTHTGAWNLPESFWDGEPETTPDTPLEDEDTLWEAWDRELDAHYWNPAIMNGAIPICHRGCALRQWLVINGDQKGIVWNDDRADNAGIAPVLGKSGNPLTFTEWYMGWLNGSLQKVGESQA
jgi:SMI1 / KNR4 family (SUKH-1)